MSEKPNNPKAVEIVRNTKGEIRGLVDNGTGAILNCPTILEMEEFDAGATVADLIERRRHSN